ncbi:MAG: penicillin-binding protein 2 [Desulfotalea sp.]
MKKMRRIGRNSHLVKDSPEKIEESLGLLRGRIFIPLGVLVIFFVIIILRLWTLQVVNGYEYEIEAEGNRFRERQIPAPRGRILDQHGIEIVTNRPSFNVVMVRDRKGDKAKLFKQLSPVLKMSTNDLWEMVRKGSKNANHIPIMLKKDVDWNTLAYLENNNHSISGVRIEVQPVRVYHFGDLAANTIGYTGVITQDILKKSDRNIYRGGDVIGRLGLEKVRETDLRGRKGSRKSEVNHIGFEQRIIDKEEPTQGSDVYLTIDIALQQKAESLLKEQDRVGSVVVAEVNTGRLLTVASSPSRHLADFVGGISKEKWNVYLNDKLRTPLVNKPVQAIYPPGSVYKMVVAYAGLAEGLIDENSTTYCPGYYQLGNRKFRCWKRSGHGEVNLRMALGHSCDVYFYQLGERLGVDKIAEYATKFGLGRKTGVEIEGERAGLVPTKAWNKKIKKRSWQKGETLNLSIGQGYNQMTPLQICMMTTVLANNGTLYKPQIVEQVINSEGEIVEKFKPIINSEIKNPGNKFSLIREGMVEVVQGVRGTARKVAIPGIIIAGKTGTAQVVSLSKHKGLKKSEIPYKDRDHAWFTAYAPAENPVIAVTVMIEHGEAGGRVGGPIAREIIREYFKGKGLLKEEKKGD